LQAIPEVTVQTEVQGVDEEGNPVTLYPEGSELFEAHTQEHALEWSDPTNWHENPVMKGDQRTHGGKLWESLIDYNVWEPPVAWREIVVDGYPAWVQPTGSSDAYPLGFKVTHNGQDWESDYPANVWEPGVFGWTALVVEPPSNEWQPNTAYATGDIATYLGIEYRCRQGHTSLTGWEPPNVPALWEVV
jgi:hypothetical protein